MLGFDAIGSDALGGRQVAIVPAVEKPREDKRESELRSAESLPVPSVEGAR